MPWTQKQHNFFEAVAHGMKPRNGSDLSKKKAATMAAEGVEHDAFGAVAGAPQLSPFARMLAKRRSRGMRPVGDGGMLDSGPSPSGHFAEGGEAKKPKLGSGKRFSNLKHSLAAKGADDPGALAAWIGRKKFGAKKMAALSHAEGGEVHEESMGEKPEHELPDYPPDVYRGETAQPEPEHIPDPEEDTSTVEHHAFGGYAGGGMEGYGQDDMYDKYGSEPLYEGLIADDLGPEYPVDAAGAAGPEYSPDGHALGPVASLTDFYTDEDEAPSEDADDHLFDPFDPDVDEDEDDDDGYAAGGPVGFARALRRR